MEEKGGTREKKNTDKKRGERDKERECPDSKKWVPNGGLFCTHNSCPTLQRMGQEQRVRERLDHWPGQNF